LSPPVNTMNFTTSFPAVSADKCLFMDFHQDVYFA
jgi:hypothetical protein